MTFLEVLVEGSSDVPVVREILTRRLGLRELEEFRILKHRGKGRRPSNPRNRNDPSRRGLLDQLPARLRAYEQMAKAQELAVVVLLDADDDPCTELKSYLLSLSPRPARVLFRIAIEELESWFLADPQAVRRSFPRAKLQHIPRGSPDRVIGAWEALARVLGEDPGKVTGREKTLWAEAIAPHLDFDEPGSPSLRAFITGVERLLRKESG